MKKSYIYGYAIYQFDFMNTIKKSFSIQFVACESSLVVLNPRLME